VLRWKIAHLAAHHLKAVTATREYTERHIRNRHTCELGVGHHQDGVSSRPYHSPERATRPIDVAGEAENHLPVASGKLAKAWDGSGS